MTVLQIRTTRSATLKVCCVSNFPHNNRTGKHDHSNHSRLPCQPGFGTRRSAVHDLLLVSSFGGPVGSMLLGVAPVVAYCGLMTGTTVGGGPAACRTGFMSAVAPVVNASEKIVSRSLFLNFAPIKIAH